jgi:hypothetical protein
VVAVVVAAAVVVVVVLVELEQSELIVGVDDDDDDENTADCLRRRLRWLFLSLLLSLLRLPSNSILTVGDKSVIGNTINGGQCRSC